MSQAVVDFIKCIDTQKYDDLKKYKEALKALYDKDRNVFGKNDWKNHLLGLIIESDSDSKINKEALKYKTNAFMELAKKVDLYLKENSQFLRANSEVEYERNLSLCEDISIPCFNITSSFQSTETIIKNFYFCIYAAYQIITPYREREIKEIKETKENNHFDSMFRQKFSVHPFTIKECFDRFNKDDSSFFMDNVVDDQKNNLDHYIQSIKDNLKSIFKNFIDFLEKCNNLYFALMCRWLELFLKSLSLIPPKKLIQILPSFLSQKEDDEIDLVKSLDEIIMKSSIFRSFSETSSAAFYIFSNTTVCFSNNQQIIDLLNFGVKRNEEEKMKKEKEDEKKENSLKKKIREKIHYLTNFIFIDDNEFKVPKEIEKYISYFASLKNTETNKDETNKDETKKSDKMKIAELIEKTMSLLYNSLQSHNENTKNNENNE